MTEEFCCNCKFFSMDEMDPSAGECRRWAPRPLVEDGENLNDRFVFWPTVFDNSWCGEWKALK